MLIDSLKIHKWQDLIFTRPTKVPPSLKPGDRITTWRTTSSVTSSTSSPFIVITSPYFPDSAVTKESLARPTRYFCLMTSQFRATFGIWPFPLHIFPKIQATSTKIGHNYSQESAEGAELGCLGMRFEV